MQLMQCAGQESKQQMCMPSSPKLGLVAQYPFQNANYVSLHHTQGNVTRLCLPFCIFWLLGPTKCEPHLSTICAWHLQCAENESTQQNMQFEFCLAAQLLFQYGTVPIFPGSPSLVHPRYFPMCIRLPHSLQHLACATLSRSRGFMHFFPSAATPARNLQVICSASSGERWKTIMLDKQK